MSFKRLLNPDYFLLREEPPPALDGKKSPEVVRATNLKLRQQIRGATTIEVNSTNLFTIAKAVLMREFQIPKEKINHAARFREDLGFDFLKFSNFLAYLSAEIGIASTDIRGVKTLGELLEMILKRSSRDGC